MKKIILLAALTVSFTGTSLAQSFYGMAGDTATASGNGLLSVYNNIHNNTSSPIVVRWKIISHSANVVPTSTPGDWKLDGFCDNVTCYIGDQNLLDGVSYTITDPYPASGHGDFHVNYDATTAPLNSSAWIRVQVQDTNTSNNTTKIFTFIGTKGTSSVVTTKRSTDEVVLFPNPAKNILNVVFDPSQGVRNIAVYNLIGKAVRSYKVAGSSAQLNIEDIPSGVYYIRLLNAQNQVVATRRFTHQ